jgi:hypothetical protein
MIRLVYLIYYFKQLDKAQFKKFFSYAKAQIKISGLRLWLKILGDSLRYNISLLEFFQFRFYEKDSSEKSKWAGTGFMYEYQLLMNPKHSRDILDDKTKFYRLYGQYFLHKVADIKDLRSSEDLLNGILSNPSGKIVFKIADGKCGRQVKICKTSEFTESTLIPFMEKEGYDLVEEFIIQHSCISELSPSAVNTVRIFTQLGFDEVEILGCRFRISVSSFVDNMAAGNLAAPIDEVNGVISGPGVYSDITKQEEIIHPVTKVKIVGFQIPFWPEILELAKSAALVHPENRSIGWDIAVTEKGPALIEGNHDWCKLVWQLPVKEGLKQKLVRHL